MTNEDLRNLLPESPILPVSCLEIQEGLDPPVMYRIVNFQRDDVIRKYHLIIERVG